MSFRVRYLSFSVSASFFAISEVDTAKPESFKGHRNVKKADDLTIVRFFYLELAKEKY